MRRARRLLSTYADMEELIRLGAYRAGSSPEVDRAVALTLRVTERPKKLKPLRTD